jgi:hypothetical protein
MKTAAITGAIALMAFTGAAFAQANPQGHRPDYVAVMQALDRQGDETDPTVTITHHEGLFRTESSRDGRASIGFGPDVDNPVLRWSRNADGEITALELHRDHNPGIETTETPRPLGLRSTIAGQDCAWSEAAGKLSELSSSRQQTCITDDGIVIETKLLGSNDFPIYHSRLTRLDRRPISEKEMHPPAEIMTADFWLRPLREHDADPSLPDFEIIMESPGKSTIKVLRHYPWLYREQRYDNDTLRVTIWNELENQGILYMQHGDTRHLNAGRASQSDRPPMEFDMTFGKAALGKSDTVLGETCDWFDLFPGAADARKKRCLTRDGLVLKEDSGGMASGALYTATSLRRRPVALSEMRLPAEAFAVEEWGLAGVR